MCIYQKLLQLLGTNEISMAPGLWSSKILKLCST